MVPNETPSGLDRKLEAVGHAVRREVLFELRRAVREGAVGVSMGSLSATGGDSPEVALEHRHLPKLVEYGFVAVEGKAVRPGPMFEELLPLLDCLAPDGGGAGADHDGVGPYD